MPHIRSISLDAETFQIAKTIPNFSKFVRECLRRHQNHEGKLSMIHRQPGVFERTGFCLPSSLCPVCWIDGVATDHNFDLYMGRDPQDRNRSSRSVDESINHPPTPYEGPEVGNREWLLSTIGAPFPISGIDAVGNAKPQNRKKPSVLRKIVLKFL
jgi:hypothetical protein|tara:strand:+ start:522 stop:989 length:468 start_codon:yes stop_codon:yes gene_type:complete